MKRSSDETTPMTWEQQVGTQHDWLWRGWSIRYSYRRARITAQTEQDDVPMLLLHGFGAAIGHWRYNMPEFSRHHTVYAMDLLGFGASQKTVTRYNTDLWLEQVHDFWQTFIRRPMIVVGNSLGSLVSFTAAVAYPEMVAGLVMLNLPDASVLQLPVPSWGRDALKPLAWLTQPAIALLTNTLLSPPIFDPFFRYIRRPPVIRKWTTQAYANPKRVDDDLVRILSSPAYDRGAARTLAAMTRSPKGNPEHLAKVALPRSQTPMLLIWGKQDRLVPPSLGPLLAKANPKLQLIELDQAGHCPHDECPERVNTLVLDWIQRLPPVDIAACGGVGDAYTSQTLAQ